jgi:hypothetical protein
LEITYLFAAESGLFDSWFQYPFVVLVTSAIWITVTYMTPAEDKSVLRTFYQKIQPGGPGWKKVIDEAAAEQVNITDDSQGWSVPFGNYRHVVGLWNDLWRHVFNRLLDLWSIYPSFYYTFIAIVFGILLVRTWKNSKGQGYVILTQKCTGNGCRH